MLFPCFKLFSFFSSCILWFLHIPILARYCFALYPWITGIAKATLFCFDRRVTDHAPSPQRSPEPFVCDKPQTRCGALNFWLLEFEEGATDGNGSMGQKSKHPWAFGLERKAFQVGQTVGMLVPWPKAMAISCMSFVHFALCFRLSFLLLVAMPMLLVASCY